MKRWNALLLTALLLCPGLSAPAADETPPVLGVLEVRGLDSLAGAAFELSKAAGQPVAREAISLALYNALGTMPGMGLAPRGNLRALFFARGDDQGSVALLLPVENQGQDYLDNLGQAGWRNESETADGLLHYVAPDGAGTLWTEVYFLKRGATLVAGQTAADVRKADAARAALPPILPVEGDAAIQIRLAALVDAFGPQIQEQLDQALKAPDTPPEAAAMGTLYLRAYLAVARQIRESVVGLGVTDGQLKLHTRMAPVAGTTLAKWIGTLKAPAPATAALANLPEALAAEAMNLGDLALLAPAYFRYVDAVMAAMPAQPGADLMKTYLDRARTYWDRMAGDFSIALLPPTAEQPLRLVEYIALKDATGLRELNRQLIQDANEMMKSMMPTNGQPMPFQFDLAFGEPRAHRETAIDTLTYAITLGDELAAVWPKAIPTKFALELAWLPEGLLAVVGDPALTDSLVDRVLDGSGAPLAERPAWKAAYPDPDENPVDFTHLALFDTLRAYLGLVDSHTGQNLAANIPESSGNLEATSYVAMGGLMNRFRFSLADIAAVAHKAREAQDKAQAEMMKQMGMQGEMQIEDEPGLPDDAEMVPWDPDAAEETEADEPAPAGDNPGADTDDAPATQE